LAKIEPRPGCVKEEGEIIMNEIDQKLGERIAASLATIADELTAIRVHLKNLSGTFGDGGPLDPPHLRTRDVERNDYRRENDDDQ
jgi:hypothetical protein